MISRLCTLWSFRRWSRGRWRSYRPYRTRGSTCRHTPTSTLSVSHQGCCTCVQSWCGNGSGCKAQTVQHGRGSWCLQSVLRVSRYAHSERLQLAVLQPLSRPHSAITHPRLVAHPAPHSGQGTTRPPWPLDCATRPPAPMARRTPSTTLSTRGELPISDNLCSTLFALSLRHATLADRLIIAPTERRHDTPAAAGA